MRAEFYIELPPGPDMPCRIARWRNGRLEPVSANGLKVSGEPKAVAFAPALSVAHFRIPLAGRSQSELRKAALYAVEDDLAQSIDDVHATLAPRNARQAARDLYIVDRQLLNTWTSALGAMGLGHADIIPESSLNPPGPAIYDFGDRLLLSGETGALGADTSWPDEVIRELISASGLGGVANQKADALETLAQFHTASPGVNLQNVAETASGRTPGQRMRAWAVAAALLAGAGSIWIANVWIDTANLQRLARQQELTARQMYRAQFPAAADPADIHLEVRRIAQQFGPGGAGGFRNLSAALYTSLAETRSAQVSSLTYDQDSAALSAALQFANRADEVVLLSHLEMSGLEVETIDARESSGGFSATYVIRGQP